MVFFIVALPTQCTFTREILLQQLILCTSRKRQDVNGCCVCHRSTKPPDPLVLLVGNDRQPEAWGEKTTCKHNEFSAHTSLTSQWQPPSLTCPACVHLDPTLERLQPAARHAAQVGGVLSQRRQCDWPNAITVGRITLAHHGVMTKVSGNTFIASYGKKT